MLTLSVSALDIALAALFDLLSNMPGRIQQPLYNSRKAVLVGISYATNDNLQDNDLSKLPGTHEDVKNLRKVLMNKFGWDSEDITLLLDDTHVLDERWPSRANMMAAMEKLVDEAYEGDCIVFAFSGHGGQVKELIAQDELDGYDEVILPVDATCVPTSFSDNYFGDTGETFKDFIRDNDIRDIFGRRLRAGVHCVLIFDCCHSGTASDLPPICPDNMLSPISPTTPVSPLYSPPIGKAVGGFVRAQTSHDESAPVSWGFAHTTSVSDCVKDVTSWSACLDDQLTYGGKKGGIFMKAFTQALFAHPAGTITHAELLKSLRRELDTVTHDANEKGKGKPGYPCQPPRPQLASLWAPHVIWKTAFSL